ncbi:hypothetical protein QE152_g22648 [Popillia japonica]|uniref:Uncharacterized protein n=1 Tax=Popillia japonica TaxID=7064 RepID=A0AAW1KLG3_POPJA
MASCSTPLTERELQEMRKIMEREDDSYYVGACEDKESDWEEADNLEVEVGSSDSDESDLEKNESSAVILGTSSGSRVTLEEENQLSNNREAASKEATV